MGNFINMLLVVGVLWTGQSIGYIAKRSPLMEEVEAKKALLYYNKSPMRPTRQMISSIERRSSKGDQNQSPGQDRIFIKPYKFPFWGLPYGVYSKGGFFNPGLFPFVPGGVGFPPYDGVFGSPWGPGQFPGPGPSPFPPLPSSPATTAAPPAPPPSPSAPAPPKPPPAMPSDDYGYGYYGYYPRRYPRKRKPSKPKYCSCYDEDEDSEDYGCPCYPTKPKTTTTTPKPYKPYKKPKKPPTSGYKKPQSKGPCKYGYSSGSNGGCKPPPPPPKPVEEDHSAVEEEDCAKGYYKSKGKCMKYKSKAPPQPHYYEEHEEEGESEDPYEHEAEDAADEYGGEEVKVVPQYIPVYFGFPYQQPMTNYSDPYPTPPPSPPSPIPMPQEYNSSSPLMQQIQYAVQAHITRINPQMSQSSPISQVQVQIPNQYQYQPQIQPPVSITYSQPPPTPQPVMPIIPEIKIPYNVVSSAPAASEHSATSQNPIIMYLPITNTGNSQMSTPQQMNNANNPRIINYSQTDQSSQQSPMIISYQTLSDSSSTGQQQQTPSIEYVPQPLNSNVDGHYNSGDELQMSTSNVLSQYFPAPTVRIMRSSPSSQLQPVQIVLQPAPVQQTYSQNIQSPTSSRFLNSNNHRRFSTSDLNLRAMNSEDTPFIVNHLNNYTAQSLQKRNTDAQLTADTSSPAAEKDTGSESNHRTENSSRISVHDPKIKTVVSVSSSTSTAAE